VGAGQATRECQYRRQGKVGADHGAGGEVSLQAVTGFDDIGKRAFATEEAKLERPLHLKLLPGREQQGFGCTGDSRESRRRVVVPAFIVISQAWSEIIGVTTGEGWRRERRIGRPAVGCCALPDEVGAPSPSRSGTPTNPGVLIPRR
jgi:hypothetical protein